MPPSSIRRFKPSTFYFYDYPHNGDMIYVLKRELVKSSPDTWRITFVDTDNYFDEEDGMMRITSATVNLADYGYYITEVLNSHRVSATRSMSNKDSYYKPFKKHVQSFLKRAKAKGKY